MHLCPCTLIQVWTTTADEEMVHSHIHGVPYACSEELGPAYHRDGDISSKVQAIFDYL